jgi:hypothetical protein
MFGGSIARSLGRDLGHRLSMEGRAAIWTGPASTALARGKINAQSWTFGKPGLQALPDQRGVLNRRYAHFNPILARLRYHAA